MVEASEEMVRNGGIALISFTLFANFVLQLLEKLGKLPRADKEPGEGRECEERLLCRYPGIGAFARTADEIRQIHEDGIRRAIHDDQVLKVLQQVEQNMRSHTDILRKIDRNYRKGE